MRSFQLCRSSICGSGIVRDKVNGTVILATKDLLSLIQLSVVRELDTLVIPANSAKRFEMLFALHEAELLSGEKDFDELILTYFDEKNQIHAFHFAKIERCWVNGSLPKPKDWIALNRRCRYAR